MAAGRSSLVCESFSGVARAASPLDLVRGFARRYGCGMEVKCTSCNAPTEVPDRLAGQLFTCPACGRLSDALPKNPRRFSGPLLVLGVLLAGAIGARLYFIDSAKIDHDFLGRRAVLVYLSRHTPDPASVEIVEWGETRQVSGASVSLPESGARYFVVPLKYRAKDEAGKVQFHHRVFIVQDAEVVLDVAPEDVPAR
jgi:predicted RNA-binding Zn-ribbon protein involved in translation (DUF1610 family)